MAYYGYEEEEVWKCLKHPSRQRPCNGICPICLHDRLITLCPDCANVRPCSCCPPANNNTAPFSSSSSSSMSSDGVSEIGPLSSLIDDDDEPANNFRRSRSVVAPFLRSRFAGDRESAGKVPPAGKRRNSSIWSLFRNKHKSKKGGEQEQEQEEVDDDDDYAQRVVIRSRSVGVAAAKGRGWYFPSPMKTFRQSKKTSKVVQEQRLPNLQRG